MKLSLDFNLTPAQVAEAFCDLDDERQAQFFVEVARLAQEWPKAHYQWSLVGNHLRDCECSTEAARDMVREIAEPLAVAP